MAVSAPDRFGSEGWRQLRRLVGNWQGLAGLILVLLFFASALFAPVLAPHDPNALDIPARLSGPSWQHFAGTDQLGRDIWTERYQWQPASHKKRDADGWIEMRA